MKKRGQGIQSPSVTPGKCLRDLLDLTETEEGPKVGHGLDLEVLELVLIPDLKDQEVRDKQGQIGHITMNLSGGSTEVLLIVKGEAHVLELMAGLATALTRRMTTAGQGLEVVTQVDPPLTLAHKKTQNRPLTPDPTGTQNPQIVLGPLSQIKEHNIQNQNPVETLNPIEGALLK